MKEAKTKERRKEKEKEKAKLGVEEKGCVGEGWIWTNTLTKLSKSQWGDGSMPKSTGYSPRGPGFGS